MHVFEPDPTRYNLKITDSHCHLQRIKEQSPALLQLVLDTAHKHDIQLFDIGIAPSDWEIRQKDFSHYPFIYQSVGLHPSLYGEYTQHMLIEQLEPLAPHAIAIGETGLDWYRMYAPKAQQYALFETQVTLAKKYKKPLIIHARDCIDEVLDIIQSHQLSFDNKSIGIMHCFSGNVTQAKRSIDLGLMVSFSANISYSSTYDIQQAVSAVPKQYILAETDSPYILHKSLSKLLSKKSKQEKKRYETLNSPLYLPFLYDTIASLYNMPLVDLANLLRDNFNCFINR